jgi:hypothetical protein
MKTRAKISALLILLATASFIFNSCTGSKKGRYENCSHFSMKAAKPSAIHGNG